MKIVDLLKNNLNSLYKKYFDKQENPIFYIAGSQNLLCNSGGGGVC